MDLISITQAVWRHKFAAIPVMLLTVLGLFYVYAIKPAAYQASSELLLLSAPNPPSASQIAADPKLAKVNPSNPYVNFEDLPVVADAVLDVVASGASQQALARAGADPQYQVTLSADSGSPPILAITGVGSSVQQAIRSATLVTKAAVTDLRLMQEQQHVSSQYMITATQLVRPEQAQEKLSGKLRMLIAVLGLGVIMLFVVVSVADLIEQRRSGAEVTAGGRPGNAIIRQEAYRPPATATASRTDGAGMRLNFADPESLSGESARHRPLGGPGDGS